MRWLRRAEVALFATGLALLGGAAASVVRARVYQARQERAFLGRVARAGSTTAPGREPPAAADPDADPLVLGRIEIPRLEVSAIVREGDDAATLAVAVGHVPGTARPGERGNMALAGHRDSFFRALRNIRAGDTIRFRTLQRRYDYQVDRTEVVEPDETRVLAPSRKPVLTLVTCYPFGFVGSAPDRFIVRASRVRTRPVAMRAPRPRRQPKSDALALR